MAIKVLFLGRLGDLAGGGERSVAAAATIAELIAGLEPELARALESDKVRVAVNGTLGAATLRDGDEVAFLPPVSGG